MILRLLGYMPVLITWLIIIKVNDLCIAGSIVYHSNILMVLYHQIQG